MFCWGNTSRTLVPPYFQEMNYRPNFVISYLGLDGAISRCNMEWKIPVSPGKDLDLIY